MTNITVLAVENKDIAKLFGVLRQLNIPHYEIEKFFEVEGFMTLEEVEMWWEEK